MKSCNWVAPLVLCLITFSGCNESPSEGTDTATSQATTAEANAAPETDDERRKDVPSPKPSAASPDRACNDWISGKQAREIVDQGGVLLDVRTPEEFATKHLEGAININVEELESRMSELPKDEHLVVYCGSGRRAERAAKMLTTSGYKASEIGTMDQYDPAAPAGCPE